MKYEIIEISSFECDPYTFDPVTLGINDWDINLTFTIGYNNIGDYFHLRVCSLESIQLPKWFTNEKILVLKNWNLNNIIRLVNQKIDYCSTDSWENTAKKLSKYMDWEFQNYKPYQE